MITSNGTNWYHVLLNHVPKRPMSLLFWSFHKKNKKWSTTNKIKFNNTKKQKTTTTKKKILRTPSLGHKKKKMKHRYNTGESWKHSAGGKKDISYTGIHVVWLYHKECQNRQIRWNRSTLGAARAWVHGGMKNGCWWLGGDELKMLK